MPLRRTHSPEIGMWDAHLLADLSIFGRLVATNIFEEVDGRWRMVVHQAGALMVPTEE